MVQRRRPSGFIEPTQPSKVVRPPPGPLWVHEIKHDGYRLMVRRDGDHLGGTKRKPPLKLVSDG
jgi:ATP-dependent DNA ligase